MARRKLASPERLVERALAGDIPPCLFHGLDVSAAEWEVSWPNGTPHFKDPPEYRCTACTVRGCCNSRADGFYRVRHVLGGGWLNIKSLQSPDELEARLKKYIRRYV